MKIKSLYIKNFRGIKETETPIDFDDLNVFIGDNGTCKTAVLEALNYCLSPGYIASRFDINDFHNGTEDSIEIIVEFVDPFLAKLPDGFATQSVECNRVRLMAKKREKAAPGKAFSDLVTTTHHVVPVAAWR
jgi:predicted ATP-dependent endonuclease of OLD family